MPETTYVAVAFRVYKEGETGDVFAEGDGTSYSDALRSLARDIDRKFRDPSLQDAIPHKHIEVCVEKQK